MKTDQTYSSLFLQLLERRGIHDSESLRRYLHADLTDLEDPFAMKNMDLAVRRVLEACDHKEPILVHGDYDVDGVTASAILLGTLKILGADVESFLPVRDRDGYGVSLDAIQKACEEGKKLLITADCGITAHDVVAAARKGGMDVIVIDHHRIPPEGLPEANIILNPQQTDCNYPCQELSAGGLAFKLSHALIGKHAFDFLDLAALSTVCDVAPLVDENRIIVREGLKKLSDRPSIGLQALRNVANVRARALDTKHLGFVFGPRINAAGRMHSPKVALDLLISEQPESAKSLALELDQANRLRQKQEREIVKEAKAEVERTFHFNRDRVIVVGKEGWHPGIVGIVASRLVDRYKRPAVVIGFKDGQGKGSGRSIKGFNLFQAMDGFRDLMVEFGGHAQAIGLSVSASQLEALREAVNEYANNEMDRELLTPKLESELELSLDQLSSAFVQELQMMEPHGAGNPRPLFYTPQVMVRSRPEKVGSYAFRLCVNQRKANFEVRIKKDLYDSMEPLQPGMMVNLYYSLKIDTWQGLDTLLLDIKEIQLD